MKEMMTLLFFVFTCLAAEEKLGEGIRLLDSGEVDEARIVFQDLAGQQVTAAYFYLGRIAHIEKDWEGAIAFFKRAVTAGNENSITHHWLGKAYLEKLKAANLMQKASLAKIVLNHYEKALTLDPDNIAARESLAYFRFNAHPLGGGSKSKAKQEAQKIVSLDPLRGSLLLADFQRSDKEYPMALETYQTLLAQQPDAIEALFEMGKTLQLMERVDEATQAFENVLRLDPNHLAALYCVGRNSAISGKNLARGATCLSRYLAMELRPGLPSKAAAFWRLGMIYQGQGSLVQARESFKKAVTLEPENESFQKTLELLETLH